MNFLNDNKFIIITFDEYIELFGPGLKPSMHTTCAGPRTVLRISLLQVLLSLLFPFSLRPYWAEEERTGRREGERENINDWSSSVPERSIEEWPSTPGAPGRSLQVLFLSVHLKLGSPSSAHVQFVSFLSFRVVVFVRFQNNDLTLIRLIVIFHC